VKSWRSWIASLRTATKNSSGRVGATRVLIPPERGWPLRPRLFFYVTIALLPIAVVSVLQGLERSRVGSENVHDRLVRSARDAAVGANNVLAQAERTLRAVASFPEVGAMTKGCDYWLGVALATTPTFANIARIDVNGDVACSAIPTPDGAGLCGQRRDLEPRPATSRDRGHAAPQGRS
jgi:hypothetical protein